MQIRPVGAAVIRVGRRTETDGRNKDNKSFSRQFERA